RVDVNVDLLLGVFHLQEEQLRDHQICDVIVNRRADKNDAVLEETRIDVLTAFAASGLFHHHGNEHGLRYILAGSIHFFCSKAAGSTDRWTLTFAFRKSRVLPSRICSAKPSRPSCSSSSLRIFSGETL